MNTMHVEMCHTSVLHNFAGHFMANQLYFFLAMGVGGLQSVPPGITKIVYSCTYLFVLSSTNFSLTISLYVLCGSTNPIIFIYHNHLPLPGHLNFSLQIPESGGGETPQTPMTLYKRSHHSENFKGVGGGGVYAKVRSVCVWGGGC